uniref:Uncharacterized protein n=1 Tax=Arundo donax TaxID=35708 RepID=A0A0A8ZJG3_ARUDO
MALQLGMWPQAFMHQDASSTTVAGGAI